MKTQLFPIILSAAIVAPIASAQVGNTPGNDFGKKVIENILHNSSSTYFGVDQPLIKSALPSATIGYRTPGQHPGEQIKAAIGLNVQYLTRQAANHTDMMAWWPAANPTHLITCVESAREGLGVTLPSGIAKYNPSVQRIELATGKVETLLRGMDRCDGIRTTPWGTILATEEAAGGGAYEIMGPLAVTDYTVTDRGAAGLPATIVNATGNDGSNRIQKRPALPAIAWEGLSIMKNGVMYGGDELRPGDSALNRDGGALFKFVPATFHPGGKIDNLSNSPLVSGQVYAFQVSCYEVDNSRFPSYGQGCEVGVGAWVKVNAATATADADANGATGYYRPEDLHADPLYVDPNNLKARRICWTNTGREEASHYAEVMCGIDSNVQAADEKIDARTGLVYLSNGTAYAYMTVNRLVEGDSDFNSFDNLDFQPVTGNVYVIEDHENGDIFGCLPDGADRDIKTDGCVKVLSVKDSSAEPTGFVFHPTGEWAVVSIQHSDDSAMPKVDDFATDDVLIIRNFRVR